jgi:hypothetical protein
MEAMRQEECARRIEELVGRIGTIADPEDRDAARQLMEAILEFHGEGLQRMLEITSSSADPTDESFSAGALIRRFAADPLVSALLILHDLHPDDLETRVLHALGKWHGSATLIGAFEGVLRVRLSGSGCGMKEAVEVALREAAPDAVAVVFEESFGPVGFVPLTALGIGTGGAE